LTVTTAKGSVTYSLAKALKGKTIVKYFTVSKSTGKVTAKAKTPAGTYKLTIKTTAGGGNYKTKTVSTTTTVVINKAAAKKGTTAKTLKAKSLAKKSASFSIKPVTDGKVTYKVVEKDAKGKLSFSAKTGKITVAKGTPKDTYTMKVKISAKAGKNYKALKAKTYTIAVRVK